MGEPGYAILFICDPHSMPVQRKGPHGVIDEPRLELLTAPEVELGSGCATPKLQMSVTTPGWNSTKAGLASICTVATASGPASTCAA